MEQKEIAERSIKMAGNLMNGLLVIILFSLFLCLGMLVAWTIHELPQMIQEWREWKRWKRAHSRIFF